MSDYHPDDGAAKTVLQIATPSTGPIRQVGGWEIREIKFDDSGTPISSYPLTNDYDETPSQLRRRLPLGTRVRHLSGFEGVVFGYEYGQVGIKVDEGSSAGDGRDGRIRYCYGRNVTACDPS